MWRRSRHTQIHTSNQQRQLREAVLKDTTATQALTLLASDRSSWVNSYLAALEEADLLRPEDEAPPIRQTPQVLSTVATLATGLLLGPAGNQIVSEGNLIKFFEQVRRWYGNTPEVKGSALIPDLGAFNLNTSRPTQTQAFNIYVPYGEARLGLPPSITVPNPNFSSFLNGSATSSDLVSLTGPLGYGQENFVPQGIDLPYTIRFENAATATRSSNEVRIVTQLDDDLDARTFQLGTLRLGDIQVTLPGGRGSFQGDFDFTQSKGFILRVSAGVEPITNVATWLIQAIDPLTGEVLQNRSAGLLPPNDAQGQGAGWINYTIQPKSDRASGTEISSEARVFFNTSAPMATGRVTNLLDATAPTTTLSVTPLANGIDYNVQWNAIDDGEGAGLKHVNVYVSENGGDFTLWQRQTTATNGVFTGKAGQTYEFLALAADQAGNQEQPRPGIAAPQDGTTTNLGTLPTNSSVSAVTLNPAPQPSELPSTNPLFQAVESGNGIPAANSLSRPAEFDQVLRPFSMQAFATGIDRSHGNIAPLAIAQLPDGAVLLSGGANRGSIYRVSAQGGRVDAPLVTLEHPLFDFALDRNGSLWATTGGGALLQLNAQTGQIIRQYGDGITQSLAIDPTNGKIYVSSGRGIEVFNPITETFEHFSDLRVGNLAFNPADGKLWGAVWPDRGDVVRFDATGKAQRMLQLNAPVDSIAFGQPGTQLAGLLFVSTNDNPNTAAQQAGDLLLVDLVTLRRVAIATGGSRGDLVRTTTDGRLLISQSNQVDVLSPLLAPKVVFTNPAPDATIALPDGDLTITFDQDMFLGFGIEAHSAINKANYELVGKTTGIRPIREVLYDPATRTARLEFDALAADEYEIRVASTIRAVNGMDLTGGYVEQFTAISDFSAYLDIQFTHPRSDRFNRTVSFDVTLTNKSDQDLRLPLMLLLDPGAQVTGQPIGATRDPQGSYLIDLSQTLPDGTLGRGATTTTRTITVSNPDALRTDFTAGVYTVPYANAAPVIQSTPSLSAIAGQPYSYNVAAIDPDGGTLSYFLYHAPEGMTIDTHGKLTWTPASQSPASAEVVLKVYDNRGGSIDQSFRIGVAGGNQLPVFSPIPTQLRAKEGQPFQFTVNATDGDRQRLVYWMENLPGGAKFESATRTLTWTPGFDAAGTYENVTFVVSDGISQVTQQTTLLVAPTNQVPTLTKPSDRTVLEGETVRIQLRGTDAEGSVLTYSSNLLPGGATLSPTGLFEWTPAYFQAGVFTIPFSVSDGETVTTQRTTITVGNVNAAPVFDQLGNWTIQEGQEVRFRAFAFDPDNPGFIPQERNLQGQLTLLEGSNPSVSYSVSGLPAGASFDATTAMFSWRPGFDRAGTYAVTFTAIDDGNGLGAKQATVAVPITVLNTNRQPQFEVLSNQTVNHGDDRTITLRATDEDGNPLVLTARGQGGFGLPSFASFVDRGDGTATLRVTPGINDGGNYPLFFTATDNAGGIDETAFVLSVNAPFSSPQGSTPISTGNQPPRITPLPLQIGQENVELQFTLAANDAESGTPILTPLTPLPSGAIFNSRTGSFRWKPTYEQAGQYAFRFEARDAAGLTSVETVNVYIGNVNRSPALTVSNRSIALGETLRFSVVGTDLDANSTLTYAVDRLPEGATFNGQTGEFVWTPTAGQMGDYTVNFSTTDGNLSATKPVVLRVVTAPEAPTVSIDLTPSFAAVPGQKVALQAIADSFAAITNLTLSVNGQPLTLDGQGRGYFTATTTGRFEVTATAIDADGRVGRQSTVLKVRDVADSTAPIVTFTPSLEGSRVTGLSQIVGTVSDVNLDSWTLEIADLGEETTRTIATGHGTISGGILGQLDGEQLTDGFYQVRLSATDISGRKSTKAAIVEVQSGAKSEQYLKQETDLSVDLGGVRVNLVRSYDSLQRDEIGLFGAGWSLAAIDSQIQTNVPLTGSEATGVYNPFQTGTRLYLTTPTGDRAGFTFSPVKREMAGLTYYEPAWVADAGVHYTLRSAGAKLTQQGDRFYDLHSGRPYNPASGKFTGAEGFVA